MTTETNDILRPALVGKEWIAEIKAAYEEKGGLVAHKFGAHARDRIPGDAFTVTYLSDNGGYDADLAKVEIGKRAHDHRAQISALAEETPPVFISNDTPAQDSIGGAFDLAQLARQTERGIGNVIFLNCAPRKGQRGVNGNNLGENVYVGMLPNGTVVAGVGEESFTFLRDLAENGDAEFYKANVQIDGSQFRSRDFFPLYALTLMQQLRDPANAGEWRDDLSVEQRKQLLSDLSVVDTAHILPVDDIPDLSGVLRVVRVDTHGNLKLNWRAADLSNELLDGPVDITINGVTEKFHFGQSMFAQGAGRFSFSEGSSGQWEDFRRAAGTDNNGLLKLEADQNGFLQIALIGGEADKHFDVTAQKLRGDEPVAVSVQAAEHQVVTLAAPQSGPTRAAG